MKDKKKKKRCEVQFCSIVGVKKIVYADTPEEAFAKAFKKTVEGRNTYIGSGYIVQADVTCKSKDRTICAHADVRYDNNLEHEKPYKFVFSDNGHVVRTEIGDFEEITTNLERLALKETD